MAMSLLSVHRAGGKALVAAALACPVWAHAGQNAHTHGRITLDAAIDAQAVTLQIEAPLDSFLGFERAPKNQAEQVRVAEMVASLRAADSLFQIDPAGSCTLAQVRLVSKVLNLDDAKPTGSSRTSHASHTSLGARSPSVHTDEAHSQKKGHAEIAMTVVYSCANAGATRHIGTSLFDTFKRLHAIDAQVASAGGQFKRSLTAQSPRLTWGK